MKIIFFGSTSDSVLVLEKLCQVSGVRCQAVVTQPARPVGRKQEMTPTPVERWAKKQNIPVLSFPHQKEKPWLFENEQTVIDTLEPFKADLLVSASFGQKIPVEIIRRSKFGGLNIHPSLLPKWRGADPVPWAILTGDHQTGVTIVTLTEEFDEGKIIAQKKYPITDNNTSDALRMKLFEIGSDLLVAALPDYFPGKNKGKPQKSSSTAYARRLTRADGFEPWKNVQNPADAPRIERKFRALYPWPGLWTKIKEKRLKILSCHLSKTHSPIHPFTHHLIIDTVQLEGKNPVSFSQFQKAYLQAGGSRVVKNFFMCIS